MTTVTHEEELSGIVERVTFHNLQTGWSVLKVSPFSSPADIVPVVLHQVKVFAGASMRFYGTWITHQKYGHQFKAEKVLEIKPASTAALEKYLGSGLIKGVGPKTAKKIVRFFGDNTLSVFEEKIEHLMKVPGIAKKKLSIIQVSWEEHRAIRDVMIFLQSHGVSTLFAVKIFKQYGANAIDIVSENPYQLAQDIYGIGFFSADKIALKLGYKKNSTKRILAGVKHVLACSREEGHCYLTMDQIISNTKILLDLKDEVIISESVDILFKENEIKRRILQEGNDSVSCYYSKTLYYDEEKVSQKINRLCDQNISCDQKRVKIWIKRYCLLKSIFLSDEQYTGIEGIVQKSFSILTGGPGCGKTTTLKVLVKLLISMGKRVLLTAPTGRAAQRMSEVIGLEAKTIHRLLEWEPQKGGFKKDSKSPLECGFLIVDECSMLDISLGASLLNAIPDYAQILFIGDPDQLPSVGPGALLGDLLSCKKVTHFRLTKVFRQAAQSNIIKHAHEINRGIIPRIVSPVYKPDIWDKSVDCLFIDAEEATQEQIKFITRAKNAINKTLSDGTSFFTRTDDIITGKVSNTNGHISVEELYVSDPDENEVEKRDFVLTIPQKFRYVDLERFSATSPGIEELKQLVKKIHPWSSLHFGFTALDIIKRIYTKTIKKKVGKDCEIQILTPQVKGSLGANNLNTVIQDSVNPNREDRLQIKIGDKYYRSGDRVIQTRNNYELNVFNGDIGTLEHIDPNDFSCTIKFSNQNKVVVYQKEDLSEISLAYAITIHKSQGSEFDSIIMPVTTQHFKMLHRNLIYTGLTRAKKMAILVGNRKALVLAIKNVENKKRQTALVHLLTADSY